jgi:hypothetical protein
MSTAPVPDDDEFLGRLRRSVDSAVPPSTLDLDDVLRASRRGVRRRRSLAGVAGVVALGLVGTGVATAGGPAGLRDLAREVVTGSPGYEVVVAEASVVEVAPGVVATSEPATYLRDDGTYVLDLGLDAWRDGERFFLDVARENDAGESSFEIRLVTGDDEDLAGLRAGRPGGTTVDTDVYPSGSVVLEAGGGRTLLVDVLPAEGWRSAPWRTFVAFNGEITDAAGQQVTTIELPTARIGADTPVELDVYAAVVGDREEPAPEVRGLIGYGTRSYMVRDCTPPAPGVPEDFACAVVYDPLSGTVETARDYPAAGDDSVVEALLPLTETLTASADDRELLAACLAERGSPPPDALLLDSSVPDPPQVDGDAWRQCALDTMLVRATWFRDRAADRAP